MPRSLFEIPVLPTHPLWRGGDARLFEAALSLRAGVPWLNTVFPDPDTEAYYFWSVNCGLRMHPELLAPFLPAIPRSELLQAVSGSDSLEMFLNAGTNSAEELLKTVRLAGFDPLMQRRVLDFGCGCARVLRHLLPLSARSELWGCDIDQEAIAYCRSAIAGARFVANQAEPPLPFTAGSFDLVFSISVFTHLARSLHDVWVAELRRLVPPGGLVVVSLHGERAWRKVHESASLRDVLQIRSEDLDAVASDWSSEGFALVPNLVPKAYQHEEPYGLVFVRPGVVPALWPGFELIRYDSGVLSDWQDLAVLRQG